MNGAHAILSGTRSSPAQDPLGASLLYRKFSEQAGKLDSAPGERLGSLGSLLDSPEMVCGAYDTKTGVIYYVTREP